MVSKKRKTLLRNYILEWFYEMKQNTAVFGYYVLLFFFILFLWNTDIAAVKNTDTTIVVRDAEYVFFN